MALPGNVSPFKGSKVCAVLSLFSLLLSCTLRRELPYVPLAVLPAATLPCDDGDGHCPSKTIRPNKPFLL